MANVFNPPPQFKVPTFDVDDYEKAEEQFIDDLKKFVINRKPGKNAGQIVQFQYADGYAKYMIASMSPLELVHIPTGNAWEYPHINRLKAKDIQQNLDFEKSLNNMLKK